MNTQISPEMMRELNRLRLLVYRRNHSCEWSVAYRSSASGPIIRFTIDSIDLWIPADSVDFVKGRIESYLETKGIPLESETEEVERLLNEYDD
jgi:hypothetical protein